MTFSIFFIVLKGYLLRLFSCLEVILGYFCFTKFDVLELSRAYLTKFGVLEILWNYQNPLFCLLDRLKFAVHVIFIFRFGSKLLCLFPFLFYFLVDPVPFIL